LVRAILNTVANPVRVDTSSVGATIAGCAELVAAAFVPPIAAVVKAVAAPVRVDTDPTRTLHRSGRPTRALAFLFVFPAGAILDPVATAEPRDAEPTFANEVPVVLSAGVGTTDFVERVFAICDTVADRHTGSVAVECALG
jgi:hypothetical protein